MNTLRIILPYQPSVGRTHAALRIGNPPTADEQPAQKSTAYSLKSSLVQLQQALASHAAHGSSHGQVLEGNPGARCRARVQAAD